MIDPGTQVRPLALDPSGFEELAKLQQLVFPKARHLTPAYLEWMYLQNPDGPAFAWNAYAGEQLVSHCAAVPFRARVHGTTDLGLAIRHLATRPEHQGRGFIKALGERSLEAAARGGCTFAIGISNANSTFPFVHRLGFQMVEPFQVRVGVGAVPRGETGARFQFERVWTREVLTWRLSRPDLPYEARRRDEELVVLAPSGVPGLQVELGTFPAALVGRPLPDAGPRRPIRVWIGLDPSRRWYGRPFVNVPVQLRPAPLNFIFRDLTGRGRRLDAGSVHADMLDYDAF